MCLDGVEVQRIHWVWGDMQKVEGGGCRSEQALASPTGALPDTQVDPESPTWGRNDHTP